MRLFIAIELPDALREPLRRSLDPLERGWTRGRGLDPSGYHLTLAFLGEQPRQRLEAVTQAMERCECPAFRAHIGGWGLFPQRGGGVLWRQVRAPELAAVQETLTRALDRAGFALENRPFVSHITLARRVELPPELERRISALNPQPLRFPVEGMSLMCSRLSQQGASYQRLYWKKFN